MSEATMPALQFHSVQILLIAFSAWRRAVEDDAKRPDALTTDSILAIVMAAAACEAFINELAEDIDASRQMARAMPEETPWGRLQALADCVIELEGRNGTVEEKFAAAWQALSGEAVNKGALPYQGLTDIIRLRNGIMHIKTARMDAKHRATKITDALSQRGIALKGGPGNLRWFDRLETPAVAGWACIRARAMILAILSLVPDIDRPYVDPLWLWKHQFREHRGFW